MIKYREIIRKITRGRRCHKLKVLRVSAVSLLFLFLFSPCLKVSGGDCRAALYAMEGMDDSADRHAADDTNAHKAVSPEKHAEDTASVHGDEKHDEEVKGQHGIPSIGYIGLKPGAKIGDAELSAFKERVTKEAMSKGRLDQVRFIIFALSFLMVFLAYSKISRLAPVSRRLQEAIDWHTLGTVTGLILVVLVIPSGIIITFYFMPTSTGVYPSVEAMTVSPVLAFFRNMHNWSSEAFIWLLLLHAARTVSTHTFLGNRKFIWLTGAITGAVGWVAFLSGSFMRGDQEALEGFEHMMYSFRLFPGGGHIAGFFSGDLTLVRITTLHIAATVFIMAVLLAMHMLMRKIHVLITLRWKKAVIYFCALTLLMVFQSIFMEAPFIRGMANVSAVSGVEFTKPPWPIYFLIQGENWFGADSMVIILLAVFVPLIIFPYVIGFLPIQDKKKARTGEILFYTGVFLMLLISFIAAGGRIIAHIS